MRHTIRHPVRTSDGQGPKVCIKTIKHIHAVGGQSRWSGKEDDGRFLVAILIRKRYQGSPAMGAFQGTVQKRVCSSFLWLLGLNKMYLGKPHVQLCTSLKLTNRGRWCTEFTDF